MKRIYEAEAYDTRRPPDSHWRRGVDLPDFPRFEGGGRADVAVIGAGYTGLSAALELLERHGADVAVFEAAQPGWAASGRNGGFACLGGAMLSDAQIARRFGGAAAADFAAFQRDAIDRVATNLDRYGIQADRGPPGEWRIAHSARALAEMRAGAAADERVATAEDLAAEGYRMAGSHGGVYSPAGFPLNPMKYAAGLARAARAAGVRVFGQSPVTALLPDAAGWRLETPSGTCIARRVLVATNGYSSDDLPGWLAGRYLPALSAIFVTRPLSADERARQGWTGLGMAYDSRTLLHYVRLLPDGRFLFGMRGGFSARASAAEALHRKARDHFARLFPAWAGVETDCHWSGLVCLTGSRLPYAGPVPGQTGLFAAFGWHGNGVAAGSEAGRRIASEIAGDAPQIPAPMRMPPRVLPFGRFRRLWLRAAYPLFLLGDGPLPPRGR